MRINIILIFLFAVASLNGQERFMSSASLSYGSYEAGGGTALEMRIGFLSEKKLALGLQSIYTHAKYQTGNQNMLLMGPFAIYYLRGDSFRPFFGAEVMYGDILKDILRSNLYSHGLLRYGPFVGCNYFLLPQLAVEASVKYQFLASKSRGLMNPFPFPGSFSAHIGFSVFY